jgi:hypothetical protein
MTGMPCVFLLTKLSDLPLYYFPFFLYMYDYAVINSGYCDGYVGGFDLGNV